jgi:hypothetical protein
MRSGRWAEWAAGAVAGLSYLAGCAGSAQPNPENHACFRALDCAEGLVCVEGRCTADLWPIVPEGAGQAAAEPVPAPNAGAVPDAGP